MTTDTRSPSEIEREIEQERAGLADTLENLQDRFSVETIARQFSDQFREHGGDIGRSIGDAVKRNPMALAVTGVGLAWMMLGDRSPNHRHYDGEYDNDRDDRFGRSRDGAQHYSRRSNGVGERARHAARSYSTDGRMGPQPGDPTKPYYSGAHGSTEVPDWARPVTTPGSRTASSGEDGPGLAERARSGAASVSSNVSEAASSVSESARDAGSAVKDRAQSAVRDAGDAVSSAAQSVSDSARNTANAAAERAAALRDQLSEGTEAFSAEARERIVAAREKAVRAWDTASRYGEQGRERAVDLFEENPLIAGALAVAVGAALGAALPRSKPEDRYLGAQSDHLFHEAERIFNEEKEKLTEVAKAATEEAKKIAKEVKADADAKAPGQTAADAVVEKAKASGKRVADAAASEAERQQVGTVKKS